MKSVVQSQTIVIRLKTKPVTRPRHHFYPMLHFSFFLTYSELTSLMNQLGMYCVIFNKNYSSKNKNYNLIIKLETKQNKNRKKKNVKIRKKKLFKNFNKIR